MYGWTVYMIIDYNNHAADEDEGDARSSGPEQTVAVQNYVFAIRNSGGDATIVA